MGEHGQGTRTQLPDGRWRVAVTMADGRRVWRRTRTKREAIRVQRELVDARERDLDPSRQTLAVYLRSWIASLRDARNRRVRPRTLDHYELIVERHILGPASGLAELPLTRVTAARIQAWIDADPAAPRTVHHHHAVLRRALNIAVRQRILAHNPAMAVELPTVVGDVADPLTAEEAHALLEATAGDRLHALWRLALVTGLRQGELLGLGWDHIGEGEITVEAQLQRIGGQWRRTETKAARKVKAVSIDAETRAVLEEHRRRQAAERRPGWRYFGLVFVTANGEPYHQSEVLKAFKAACVKAGIRPRRFHDLRGTSATMAADIGIAEEVRMARMGHSTKAMSRRYAKASEVQDREAAERIAAALR